jgi:hypothetical protein
VSADRSDTYWSDLRFAHQAESRDAAAEAVEELIETAERLGFRLELGSTTPNPPHDPAFR